MTKIRPSQKKGKKAIGSLIRLTKPKKKRKTPKEKGKLIIEGLEERGIFD